MAGDISTIDPREIDRNPENPRLIFRSEDLDDLLGSIKLQGILVPLTVYREKRGFVLLDGERRWRCALKLGLAKVPCIVLPKPDRLRNIMMMFAIHNARRDWDPLPTAYKLRDLEAEWMAQTGRRPTEAELAEIASLDRGAVRRLKKLLALPQEYHNDLRAELQKPRSQRALTVDHVLEATRGAEALRKKGVIDQAEEEALRRAVVDKFKSREERNTVAPRKLARMARAVEREEVTARAVRKAVTRLINTPTYTIDAAFQATVEQADFEHGTEQLCERLTGRLYEHLDRGYEAGEGLRQAVKTLAEVVNDFLDA